MEKGCHTFNSYPNCDWKVGKTGNWEKIKRVLAPLLGGTCSHRFELLYEQRMDSGDRTLGLLLNISETLGSLFISPYSVPSPVKGDYCGTYLIGMLSHWNAIK